MESDLAPETVESANTPVQAYEAEQENARKVSCRKFLLRLIACHPSRAAHIILEGIDAIEPKEVPELTAGVRLRERQEVMGRDRNGDPRIRTIVEFIAGKYGLTTDDILSNRRTVNVVRPRQIVCYLAKSLTRSTLPAIGRTLGDRDHTTILHGIRSIKKRIKTDPALAAEIECFSAALSQKEAA